MMLYSITFSFILTHESGRTLTANRIDMETDHAPPRSRFKIGGGGEGPITPHHMTPAHQNMGLAFTEESTCSVNPCNAVPTASELKQFNS